VSRVVGSAAGLIGGIELELDGLDCGIADKTRLSCLAAVVFLACSMEEEFELVVGVVVVFAVKRGRAAEGLTTGMDACAAPH
jgi:hypothetical protein